MIADSIPQLSTLSGDQKLLLASELWDAALAEDLEIPASSALLEELDRRHEEYQKATSWKDAKTRILASQG